MLTKHEFSLPNSPYINGLAVDKSGTMFINSSRANLIYKLDASGKYIGTVGQQSAVPLTFSSPQTVLFDAIGFMYVQDKGGNRIRKFSPSGNLLLSFGDTSANTPPSYSNIDVDDHGNTYLSYYPDYGKSIKIYDRSGKQVKVFDLIHHGLAVTKSGHSIAVLLPDKTIGVLTSSNYNPKNYISGTIYEDKDGNCIKDPTEKPIAGVVVVAEPGKFYGLSDENGKYSIAVDSGTYVVDQVLSKELGRLIQPVCATEKTVTLKGTGYSVAGPDFGNKVTLSPYLTTSVSSTRRRRCFESTTKITYANAGYAPAENAKVYLQLPKEVELLSADKTYTKLPDGTYVFDVGTVAPGETKTITIQDKVTCGDEGVRGLTVCTKAWISTGKLPNGPIATVTGECNPETGKVRFVIRNTGTEDMAVGELFKIYRDGRLSTVEQYKLAAGDSLVLYVVALGNTIRLEATQPGGNGDNTLASATIEGCSTGADAISTGFVNMFPRDEEGPEVAEDCVPITDSYDPNDKQVTPTGLTSENYTRTGIALTYKIRFQNTGTDVAYRVVVVDTLSENLDISTLQMGSASHNYRFDVSGKGKPVLTWTFDNIMLPDSNSNEPGSHGYIQFNIKPKTHLPEKTLVENFADIFFDFNSPVRTNITANRIYDMPEVISEADRLDAENIIATPGITGFAPESGKFGTEVIVSGNKFSSDPDLNKVFFNGLPATIVSASETELKVIVPANATSGSLKVQTNDGVTQSTAGFEVYQPPVVNSFTPIEGVTGTTVTLQGKHLTETWLQTIKLGDQVCEIISKEGNSVVVRIPDNATTATFTALSKGGEAQTINAFVVWHQPAINKLNKTTDKAGATIEISGANFATAPERNTVMFGNVRAQVVQATATTIKVQVPKGAENGPVTVETPGGKAESAAHFTFIPAPEVLTFSPAIGSVGTDVTLTGKDFLTLGKQDTISFNGQKAIVLEATPTQLKVRVPRGASSGKIKVAGVGGYAVTVNDFRIEELSPEQAIEVYPNPTTGNFAIRFMHADFDIQQVQLYSALGQLIYTEKVANPRPDKLEVKLATPKAGIYILHINTERGLVTKKLNVL